ncbi:hypothetical protein [Falsiroseomonas sp.]|uniref:hypothetical protein n=1 Tax=Falsiroseomonas sp. TaxID=2870721 RepID=UPI003F70183E
MSAPPPPASLPERLRRLRLDPAALPIAVAGVVLVGAVAWLIARPLPAPTPPGNPLAAEVAELRAQLQQVAGLDRRLAALEGTTARIAGLEALPPRIAALEGLAQRVTGLEGLTQRVTGLEARPPVDLAPLRDQAAEAERRAAALDEKLSAVERIARDTAARPAIDPTQLAARGAVEALSQRLDRLSDRTETSIRQDEARAAAAATRIEALAREAAARDTALEQAQAQASQRIGATEAALAGRIAALDPRLAALEQTIATRTATLEQAIAARAAAAEAQAARLVALEGAAQRLAALEGRAGRMATIDALRATLEAGRPLGGALAGLRDAPEALTRFATAAPPTESALRLGFEDAARAGRAASEPAREGAGVLDSAVSRLSGLVTVRRGEEVLWGDAAAAEIERARRALDAGDLEGAIQRLARLSPPAKEAMRGWISQAEALVAARAALRSLAAG